MTCYRVSDSTLLNSTIENIQREYLKNNLPWSLAFSGGKDSSALLKLVYLALEELPEKTKPVTIIYCDTGVEIPIIRSFVIKTLYDLSREAVENEMPLQTQIVRPALQDRYFSKVIGRGYPPPTFKFRWCTDVLRIKPIRSVINKTNEQSVILLGIRKGESIERDRVLSRYKTSSNYYYQQVNSRNVVIYSPLIEYQASDIWSILRNNSMPESIDTEKLQILYSIANSDHANDLNAIDVLNAKGRFGCWTCTVIRHDRAVENLIRGGEESLLPLFEFRNWLVSIRDNPYYRLKIRRNGSRSPGPFTIEARKEILDKLLEAQSRAGFNLISIEETEFIRNQWLLDS